MWPDWERNMFFFLQDLTRADQIQCSSYTVTFPLGGQRLWSFNLFFSLSVCESAHTCVYVELCGCVGFLHLCAHRAYVCAAACFSVRDCLSTTNSVFKTWKCNETSVWSDAWWKGKGLITWWSHCFMLISTFYTVIICIYKNLELFL